jgi:hypothetical protein
LAYTNRNETNQLDLLHYKRGEIIPEKISNYTDTVEAGKYSLLDMSIHFTSDGTYWTRVEEGIPVTDFANNSGPQVSTEGIVRLVTKQGVYLQRYTRGEYQIESVDWVHWQPDGTILRVAEPPKDSLVFGSGIDLFAQVDAEFYRYSSFNIFEIDGQKIKHKEVSNKKKRPPRNPKTKS